MVLYPFVMCAFVWFVSRVRAKDRKKVCALIMILASAVELAAAVNLVLCDLRGGVVGVCELPAVGGLGLHFMYSGFRGIFGVLTAFAWFVTALFSYEYMKNDANVIKYDIFNLLTLGATMGIFYAADLFTLFFFFDVVCVGVAQADAGGAVRGGDVSWHRCRRRHGDPDGDLHRIQLAWYALI